jgi:hypothetical protein
MIDLSIVSEGEVPLFEILLNMMTHLGYFAHILVLALGKRHIYQAKTKHQAN